jgi:hypothetical protein
LLRLVSNFILHPGIFLKVTIENIAPTIPKFPKQNAIAKAETLTGAKYNSFPVGLEYFAKDKSVQLHNPIDENSHHVVIKWS